MSCGYVVSCEHASSDVPARGAGLRLPSGLLRSHLGWDFGAAKIAREVARRLPAPCIEGRYSRLLADLNRTSDHPRVVPSDADGVPIPANARLDRRARELRIDRYWRAHVGAVRAAVQRCIASRSRCLHLAVHSFTPVLGGRVRDCDVGLLFDPSRSRERNAADRLKLAAQVAGMTCRFNYPYRGASNGLVTSLRQALGRGCYLGFEIEINQALLTDAGGRSEVVTWLIAGAQDVDE